MRVDARTRRPYLKLLLKINLALQMGVVIVLTT